MWISTDHRFATRAAFLAACAAAGWPLVQGFADLPGGVAMDIIGPILAPATIDGDGKPVAGEVLDAGFHVNIAWHGRPVDAAFVASQVTPSSPSRRWGLPPPASPPAPAVPGSLPAWKLKAKLREAGRLAEARNAIDLMGGLRRDAWDGAAEWPRDSRLVAALMTALSMTATQMDELFTDAGAIQG
jgi:hypothetical protein